MKDENIAKVQVETDLIKNMSSSLDVETARLEKFTDRILGKLSAVITLSSILTFVSFILVPVGTDNVFLKFYLVWVFPYLIVSIGFWIAVFRASSAIIASQIPFHESNNPEQNLQFLRIRLQMHTGVLNATHNVYQNTRTLFGYGLAFIVGYLALYVLSVYAFIFFKLPPPGYMILVTVITIMAGNSFRKWYTKRSPAVSVTGEIRLSPPPSPENTTPS